MSTASDTQLARVDAAIDALLLAHPVSGCSNLEFRGHRYDAGLAWVHFAEGFGGMGARPDLNRHVENRLRAAGGQPQDAATFFLALAGPTIHTHGTDEQKQRWLRPMFTGEERWCQLFSEPGAGSDFAGLGTRAVRDGDEWVVNGQKVWNTLAHLGDWGMLVTRTDPDQPKHKGMTYFGVDMRLPGVEVRPLRQITGEAEFNEVYLTDARIPDSCRVGDVGEGWRVSLTTLMNERTAIGGGAASSAKHGPIWESIRLWNEAPEHERTDAKRDELMTLYCLSEAFRYTNMRAAEAAKVGNPGPEGSIAKLAMSNFNKACTEFALGLLGAHATIGFDYTFRRPEALSADGLDQGIRHSFLRARANSIEGGTSEILRNILGEQVLGLPGEPRVDKDAPWISVPRN
ncbi:MAG: acyl-CoA dehydrogenase [Actinobacteria bacterium]|nr:acyl-CoA dehydrogenase [Actinomycetota bacterium]MSW76282.1 acyl-CoA dehydrogenase [Actinomycetota bacterium]MSX94018.1 acyl-CoA dehydrogenase [Actinomycetota bacterium]MSZ81992.1 acyl-CoA dehydrogenase [Actinomycetota bacterium]MTB16831.1 acyl-CoA dehydrogenase [Actinomycetota bacterium]